MRALIAAAVVAVSSGLAAPALAQAEVQAQPTAEEKAKTPAETIIEQFEAVEIPTFNREAYNKDPQGYRAEFTRARKEAFTTKVDLTSKLLEANPTEEQLVEILPQRWAIMTAELADQSVLDETRKYAANPSKKIANEALFGHANAMARLGVGSFDDRFEAAKVFQSAAPEDERYALIMSMLVRDPQLSEDRRMTIYRETAAAYPDSRYTKYFAGKVRRADGVGKPFELSFTDANTGETVSMDQLRGKVVVVDFWATWCGPCIAEIPKLKELYSEYKDKGLEVVAISLDQPEEQGGLEALRKYCEANELTWPQYYQGNFWSSEFSTSWGIDSIPAVFIIDKHGNLHSTEARGKLETLVPELLAKPGPQG